jgi:nucleotide-binding universal stress UspA family protein
MVKRMLQKILVPLDGSKEAENVLPYLRDLAPRLGSHVHILGIGIGRKTRRVNRLLEDYINRVAAGLHSNKIKAEPVILYGTAADKILDYTTEEECDLIIMATHGRSGITRWWMGSVAEKVISEAPIPVLLVRSRRHRKSTTAQRSHFHKILAPLDGSDIGQAALSYVEILAIETGASVSLLQVISPPGSIEASVFGGPDWRRFIKAMHDAGENYLGGIAERLRGKGIKTTYEVLTGEPADRIVEYAEEKRVSLIAMSTHGRTGLARWVLGSVADKVLHEASMPMWLVRSPKMLVPRPKD